MTLEVQELTYAGTAYSVTIEHGADGGWSAHTTEPEVVGGLGDTRETALADWREAMMAWLEYMQERRL